MHNRRTSISLKRKKIFQKEKHHSSVFWKAFQISTNYFSLHRDFKGAECFSEKVKRLWSGSNRLRVVVKRKYCCRVVGESLISASIDHFQWEVSTRKAKRLWLISSTEQKEIILWRFCIYNVLVYYWDEKICYQWNLIFSHQCYQGFRFITLIASTSCSRRKRKFLVRKWGIWSLGSSMMTLVIE